MEIADFSAMIDQPVEDPRPENDPAPHSGVDDPGRKPPASDPQIRRGPLKDPDAAGPTQQDPPVEPHVPGEPERKVEDPPAP